MRKKGKNDPTRRKVQKKSVLHLGRMWRRELLVPVLRGARLPALTHEGGRNRKSESKRRKKQNGMRRKK